MLKRYGIKTASLNVEKMKAEYDAMAAQKEKLKKAYQAAEKDVMEAEKQLRNIKQYLGIEKENQKRTKPGRKHEMGI